LESSCGCERGSDEIFCFDFDGAPHLIFVHKTAILPSINTRPKCAIARNSNYEPVCEHLGSAYQKKANHNKAAKSFERAVQLMPTAPRPWQHLAEEYRLVGRAADADRAAGCAQQLEGRCSQISKKKG